MQKGYDYSISFMRVCAMLFIMICHLGSHFKLTAIGQFFNIGVPIFFLVSGYLYGDKDIKDIKNWIKQRAIRLYVPLLLWGIIMTAAMVVRGNQIPSFKEYIFFLLNLHGLNFIFYRMKDLAMGPWFFTVIMVCYLMTALYFIVRKHFKNLDKSLFYYGGIIPLAGFIILVYLGVNLSGLLCYMIGFGLKKRALLSKKRPRNIYVSVIVFILTINIWLISRRFIDGTIFYNQIIAPMSHVLIAVAFFIGVKWLFDQIPKPLNIIVSSKIFRWIDKISIFVYVCHDWYLDPLFVDVFALNLPLIWSILIFFLLTFITATGMSLIGEGITKGLKKVAA